MSNQISRNIKLPLVVLLVLIIILGSIFFGIQIGKQTLIRQVPAPTNQAVSDVRKENSAVKYIDIDPDATPVVFSSSKGSNVQLKAYIFNVKMEDIALPFLLSDYNHILVVNHFGDQGFYANAAQFSEESYGKGEPYKSNIFTGYFYILAEGRYLASLEPVSKDKSLMGTVIQIVAKDEATFKQLLGIAEKYSVSDRPEVKVYSGYTLPRITKKTPNYTDPKHPYKYYLPNGYTSVENPYGGFPNTYFENTQEEMICLTMREDGNDPCAFSTSGCTCCNTGCELIDYAVYASRDGDMYIEPILQKGSGSSGGTRFIYDSPHPWIYYSASYSSPSNTPKGVLDLIYLLDSMERNY